MPFTVLPALSLTWVMTGGLTAVSSFLPSAAHIGLFGLTTLIASWTVLGCSKLFEGTKIDGGTRRTVLSLAGCLVGAGAFALDQTLMVDVVTVDRHYQAGGLVESLGSHRLLDASLQPTLAGYVVFFAGLFAVRRWWWHADSFRRKRFRVSSVLLTALLGWVWSLVIAFPMLWGVTLAIAVSSIVHLSAAWVPAKERHTIVEAETHE